MRKPVRKGIPLFVLALLLAPRALTAANLVVNGDFETGDFSGWNVSGPSYTVTGFVPGLGPHAGQYSAEFQGFQIPDVLSQALSGIIPGQGYTLSFYAADIVASPNLLLQVQFGNFNAAITSLPAQQWVNVQFQAVAQSGAPPSLIIQAQDPAGAIYLDDISVTASPEPASLLLLALGLLLLLALRPFRSLPLG